MAKEEFDAIVIGAGVSGMAVASLLAHAGKRVGVFENMNQVGGRATSYKHKTKDGKEYISDIGGFHSMTMGDHGAFAVVYKEIGLGFDMFSKGLSAPQPGFLIFRNGKWDDMTELNKGENRDDFKKIIAETISIKYEDCDQWDAISFRKWLADRTPKQDVRDWYRAIGHVFTTICDDEEMSAGECVYTMKLNLEGMKSVSSGSLARGGSINLTLPLVDYVRSKGGTVKFSSRVRHILTDGYAVRGVEVGEIGPEWNEGDDLDRAFAPIVVSTVPIWQINEMLPDGELPHWFARLVESYRNPDILTSIRFGSVNQGFVVSKKALENMKYGGKEHRVAFDMPNTGGTHQGAIVGAIDPAQAAGDTFDFHFGAMGLNPEVLKDKKTRETMFVALHKDLEAMYPEIIPHIVRESEPRASMGRYGVVDGLARMPYYTGNFRIDHAGPFDGLYFAGDTVRARGCGIDCAVRSAVWCFNKIMRENLPTFIAA